MFSICRYACLLEYVQQPLCKAPANITDILNNTPCSRHIFHMDLAASEANTTPPTKLGTVTASAPKPQPRPGQVSAALPSSETGHVPAGVAQLAPNFGQGFTALRGVRNGTRLSKAPQTHAGAADQGASLGQGLMALQEISDGTGLSRGAQTSAGESSRQRLPSCFLMAPG